MTLQTKIKMIAVQVEIHYENQNLESVD